jgi:hypothetical protein
MKKEWQIFFIALILHSIYALIIIHTDNQISAYWSRDHGQIVDLAIQFNHDSKSYVESADNFLKFGVFGHGVSPDHHRTIGYPFIIAVSKYFFGDFWFYGLFVFQFILSLFIYPLFFLIAKMSLEINEKVLFVASLLTLLLGAYFQRPFYILSDLSFTFFFLLGLFTSMYSLMKKNSLLHLISILILTFAALVRPVLIFYPFAHFFILLYLSKKNNLWNSTKGLVFSGSIVLLVGCNLSSFRNYHHYKIFTPSDILGYVLLEYSTKHILSYEGKQNEYVMLKKSADQYTNWIEKDQFRKKTFLKTVFKYPDSAIKYWLGRGAKIHLLYPHYMKIGEIYGYFNREKDRNGRPMKESNFMKTILYSFSVLNALIVIFSLFYLLKKLILESNILFFLAFGLLFFVLVGPSFIAASSARFRIPIEPFLVSMALAYIYEQRKFLSSLLLFDLKKH